MQIKNGGRNTAFVDRTILDLYYGPMPEKREYIEEAQFSAPPPIPADGSVPRNDIMILPKAFTQDEIDGIKSGKNRMSLAGYITYSDTFWLFGKKTTGFCFTYYPADTSQLVTCPERAYTYIN